MTRERAKKMLDYWNEQLDRLMDCYKKLIASGVQSYEIDDRAKTNFGIPNIRKAIQEAEAKVEEYEGALENTAPRKMFGILPRDW